MSWKLWIDDIRDPPEPGWCVARSSKDAILLVTNFGFPVEMSLDHDLGESDTVMQFLYWIAYSYPYLSVPAYKIHSANPVGAQNIQAFMESWIKSKDSKP